MEESMGVTAKIFLLPGLPIGPGVSFGRAIGGESDVEATEAGAEASAVAGRERLWPHHLHAIFLELECGQLQ